MCRRQQRGCAGKRRFKSGGEAGKGERECAAANALHCAASGTALSVLRVKHGEVLLGARVESGTASTRSNAASGAKSRSPGALNQAEEDEE